MTEFEEKISEVSHPLHEERPVLYAERYASASFLRLSEVAHALGVGIQMRLAGYGEDRAEDAGAEEARQVQEAGEERTFEASEGTA